MIKRQLGNSDLHVSPVTLGGNVFGWTIDEAKSFEILDGFFAAGFNFIDTADVYSAWAAGNKGGESESIIGKWMQLRGNRDQVILATKVGADMGQGKRDLSKGHITRAVEDSLRRLNTDYIDLYQTHWDDLTTPVEETLETYGALIRQGKVRCIGASNLSPERLVSSLEVSRTNDLPKYQTFQPEYNLYAREKFETQHEKLCLENQLGVINYYSLASGFLTGKYRSEKDLGKSARGGSILAYLNQRGFGILRALDIVSAEYHTTPASVALAWLIARPSVTAPIASATNLKQLAELTEAADLQLSEESISMLTEASAY